MPLARLDNLLKNLNGNILYVDPAQLDATDSIDNKGNSALRPFKTIQRALLEAVRFSYVQGANNDLFDQTTILISPGTHYIDNRPGFYLEGDTAKTYSGSEVVIPELNLQSNLDITDSANDLYKFNSADGGVIIPRGVSIVASDLRKTKVRPLYVPNPSDQSVPKSSIFKLTGACYIYGFSIFDGDPNGNVFSNPTSIVKVPPNYSHHKLTAFEYADGKNKYVKNGIALDKTDLEMYYYKVAKAYGQNSGIPVIIDWGVSPTPDLYPNIEENRIVGDLGRGSIPITDLYAGDGNTIISNIVTVTTSTEHGLSPFASILISNVGNNTQQVAEYNGAFTVSQVISPTQFTYRLSDNPESTLRPDISNSPIVTTASDTVSSSSPYVFNCSLKSVYGMNGLHADGSKATGFKSIVTAQFTGISLQKDDRAFVLYNDVNGSYADQSSYPNIYLHQNSNSIYKPDWESFHIKASNDAFIQCVSIFAIGYAKQFVADNGGDQSITNSNSNFGAIALSSRGFKDYQLAKDDHGFITHIIPPKQLTTEESDIRCLKIDSSLTSSQGSSNGYTRVYLKDYENPLDPPIDIFRGYKIGARSGEKIYVEDSIFATVSPNYKLELNISSVNTTTRKISTVQSVSTGTLTGISTSQAVRIISEDGLLPDGIENGRVYYINTSSITSGTISQFSISENISNSTNSALSSSVNIKNTIGVTSGNLKLVSRVSDRLPGQVASPIQFDSTNNKWYISITANQSFITSLTSDPIFYIKRIIDTRKNDDKLYRVRLVIPKESPKASEPSVGFILQRSSAELSTDYINLSNTASDYSDIRNRGKIVDAWTVSGTPNTCYIATRYPHKLKEGNKVNIYNLKSSNEPSPVGLGTGTGYNGTYFVDSVIDELTFTFKKVSNPGPIQTIASTFETWLETRNCASSDYRVPPYTIQNSPTDLPYFTCEEVNNDYQIYKVDTIQKYSEGVSDGIYHVTLNVFKNTPTVSPFNINDLRLSQSIENLYPTIDLDNPLSDQYPTKSIASRKTIGKVEVNDQERSTTKETVFNFFKDYGVGCEVDSISVNGSTCTLTTTVNHGVRGIRQITIPNGSVGSQFVNGIWADIPVCGGSGSGATVGVQVSGGSIVSVIVINPGSGYSDGNTITLRGIPHTTTNGASVDVTVTTTFSFNLSAIQIIGSKNVENDGFFPIVSVTDDTITYTNANGVNESNSGASLIFSGEQLFYSSLSLQSGNTVVNTTRRHSIAVGNKVIFTNLPSQIFDVIASTSPTSFIVSGDATAAYSNGIPGPFHVIELTPTLRDTNSVSENLLSRQYVLKDDFSIRTPSDSTGNISLTDESISLSSFGFDKGDFILIDDEIMLITRVNGSVVSVKRGCLGTKIATHLPLSLAKKLNIIPVELRRNSILRASGHTFEYLGFGPGNYSTGMPTNQDRVLNDDEILISQSLPTRGGSVLYTGMNSNGDYFIGRKKYNTLTGDEELLGVSPLDSGETTSFDDLSITDLIVTNSLDATTAEVDFGNVTATGNITSNSLLVNGTATATTFVGNGTIPIGGIIMWSGTTTPSGWQLCNNSLITSGPLAGQNTPDLRDKFVVGAGNAYSLEATGGSADAVVVAHNHIATSEVDDPGHSHDMNYQQKSVEDTGGAPVSDMRYGGDGDGGFTNFTNQSGNITSNTTRITVATTISIEGESGTDKNLPPYYALAFIMRVS